MASGDETLKNYHYDGLSTSAQELQVTAGHTFTILSFTINERAGNAENFSVYSDPSTNNAGTNTYIYTDQDLPAKGTFEHTSKIVLTAGQRIGFVASSGDCDVWISYLDQEL